MLNKPVDKKTAVNTGSLRLAFLGDAVYSLLVREKLLAEHQEKVAALNVRLANLVSAAAQSSAYEKILPHLTEEETDVLKRGKNAQVGHIPKNQTVKDYHQATAVEALFGYLYLIGDEKRISEIFDIIHS
ncbi:MAG TPA: ribonuclease III [Clostridiales bacterium]|nr:ribonuclease III [Clostridiales bacterium]